MYQLEDNETYNLLEYKAKLIKDTAVDGVRYQLKAQFGPELAMYMPDPERIIGGVRKAIDYTQMRNDYTQHNLSSFLCLANLLSEMINTDTGAKRIKDD
jgi:hypothetical protein